MSRTKIIMNTVKKITKGKTLALRIALAYVAFGTLSVCSVYPHDLLFGEWSLYGLLMTFPVTILSFGFRYAEPNQLLPVFLIQLTMVLPTFLVLSIFIKDKKTSANTR